MTATLQCPECGADVFKADAEGLFYEDEEETCQECGTICRVAVDIDSTEEQPGVASVTSNDEVEDIGQSRCDGSCGAVAKFVGKPCLWACPRAAEHVAKWKEENGMTEAQNLVIKALLADVGPDGVLVKAVENAFKKLESEPTRLAEFQRKLYEFYGAWDELHTVLKRLSRPLPNPDDVKHRVAFLRVLAEDLGKVKSIYRIGGYNEDGHVDLRASFENGCVEFKAPKDVDTRIFIGELSAAFGLAPEV